MMKNTEIDYGQEALDVSVWVSQLEITPGRPDLNTDRMLQDILAAKAAGVQLLVFPEMCVSGYLLGDDWLDDALVKDFVSYNQTLLEATAGSDLVVVWGNVAIAPARKNEDGSLRKYNAVYMAQNGQYLPNEALGTEVAAIKAALPNYGEFDDKRYFHSLAQLAQEEGQMLESYLNPVLAQVKDTKIRIGATICEDMWASSHDDDYAYKPVKTVVDRGAQLVANVSCSPWKQQKNQKRHRVVREAIGAAQIPFVYANGVHIQNNGKGVMPFDGASTIYNADHSIQACAPDFKPQILKGQVMVPLRDRTQETLLESRLGRLRQQEQSIAKTVAEYRQLAAEPLMASLPPMAADESRIQRLEDLPESKVLYQALVTGVREWFTSSGLERAVIGLSGGADSALVAKILVDAIGPGNVFAVNMPSRFNSDTTKDLAADLAAELGIYYAVVPIQAAVDYTTQQINGVEFQCLRDGGEGKRFELSDLGLENLQARDRGSRVLAALASSIGGVFTNNGNKSEFLAGYSTFYGDLAGALAPIGDLYKSQVWELMRYLAATEPNASSLQRIADTIPSAELSEAQSLEAGAGDPFVYAYHDKLWFQLFENRQNPSVILEWYAQGELAEKLGIDESLLLEVAPDGKAFVADLERIYCLLKQSVIKGVQAPPNIRVSRKGRGFDMRESVLQSEVYFTKDYQARKQLLLNV